MKRLAKAAARRLRHILPQKARPAILMYHRVAAESFDPWGLAVEEQAFSDQLEWLTRHRQVIPLSEFAQRQRQRCLPADAVALTFDDGYACASKAVSHLERLDLPATIFIAPGLIERGREFWWDELAHIILEFEGESLHLDQDTIPLPDRSANDHHWPPGAAASTGRQQLFEPLWSRLRTLPPAELDAAMSELRAQSGSQQPRQSHRPLTAAELRTMASPVVEFGSHAMTHPSLPVLGHEEKALEIADSKSRCAQLTGRDPTAFAYPYGDLDADSIRMVRDAGFDCACSTEGEFVTRGSDPFALPRLQVGNWDVRRFADMLGGR